jgi:hypothetical protein
MMSKSFAEMVKEAHAIAVDQAAPFVPSRAVVEEVMIAHLIIDMLEMDEADVKAWVMATWEGARNSQQATALRLYKDAVA